MLTYHSPLHVRHNPPCEFMHGRLVPYFEMPARVEALLNGLQTAHLIELIEPPLAITRADLTLVHDAAFVDYLEYTSQHVPQIVGQALTMYHMADALGQDDYFYESSFPKRHYGTVHGKPTNYVYDSTSPLGQGSWTAILHSANLAYQGAQALLNGANHAYALCRPPGHHAGRDFAGGYCYLNNAAIAAAQLLQRGKVAIIDVDYHHGNGTQDIFWNEAQVLCVSLHGDPAGEYPYYCGYADENGAHGNIVNMPLPLGISEADYLAALARVLVQVQAWQPSAIVVSLGFDTYVADPMAQFNVDLAGYRQMGQLLAGLNLPTLYVQEGGYMVAQLGALARAFFSGVLGK
jgi:acetoin utilization deacetylase AcuC-like enzyme